MTDQTIQVVALVVSPDILTFYKTDGSVYTVTQGDPRGLAMSDEFFAQRELSQDIITLTIGKDAKTATHLDSPKRSPLIRFFRALKKDVARLLGAEVVSNEMTTDHEAAAAKVKAMAQRLMKSDDTTRAQTDDLPVRMVHSEEPMSKDETIIGVTDDGIIGGVESLSDQFQAGEEGKAPAQGPDNLIIRLAKMSQKRGHTATELLKFIEKIDLPILADGSFLAYKRLLHIGEGVYVDPHTKLVHQRIGDIVEMDEKLVDPNRRQECSQGLHVGTRHYMGGFSPNASGSGTMLVLIQPEDVIAVPINETTKMRTCRYLILADLSDKAHNLVNQNKRMDDCQETMQVVAQILADGRPAMLGRVIIGGDRGRDLRYEINGKLQSDTKLSRQLATDISEGKVTAPTKEVTPVRTINDAVQGNQANFKPEKIRDKANVVSPTAAKAKAEAAKPATGNGRQKEAHRLTTLMERGATEAIRISAAKNLKALKQQAKISWDKLGVTASVVSSMEKLLTSTSTTPKAVSKPSTSAPSKAKEPMMTDQARTAPQPKAPEPVKGSGGTRQDKARSYWDTLRDADLPKNKRVTAALNLRALKKAAKVSWSALGLGKYNVEAELTKLLD